MGIMKTVIALIFSAIVIPSLASAESDDLRVGFIGSFSGPAQTYGDACRNGFELALEELGRQGISVKYEDDQFIPAKTVTAFNKLVGIDKVQLVIVIGSTPGSAIAALAETKKIPLVAWASDRQVSRNRTDVIRSYPSGDDEGKRAVQEAIKRGLERTAVVISDNAYADSWRLGVVAALPSTSLVLDERLTDAGTDFRPFILRAQSNQVKSYALCLDPGQIGLFAKQVRELGAQTAIYGCEYFHDRAEIKASRGALVGAWFSTVHVTDEFTKKYAERFKNTSLLSGAANHYDLAMILRDIIDRHKTKDLLAELVSGKSYTGAVGTFSVRKTAEDQFFDIPLVTEEVTADGYKVIE
jgi:ABC-type branched-subunit amino acid transport system substrate-binding protein